MDVAVIALGRAWAPPLSPPPPASPPGRGCVPRG
jgi:hypothetical protein